MTLNELRERQAWTLNQKIDHSLGTIEAFINQLGGVDKVYVSFSGGKDSTVLFHLSQRLYPDILGVFNNTGNEYPDILKFVKETQESGANIQIIRPKITPRQVWDKYGFPLVSKETADRIHRVRTNPNSATSQRILTRSQFKLPAKWLWLIDASFETSAACCNKLKKAPFHRFEKDTGRRPILGTMASESQLREKDYIRNGGCNQLELAQRTKSLPLSIWTEQDIWDYINSFNIPIADIYHKGAERTGCMGCGFGCQMPGDPRLAVLYREYPKCYEMIMNYTNNGISFREALRMVLATNNIWLPDELNSISEI